MLNLLIQDGKVVAYNPLASISNRNKKVKIVINGVWFGFTDEIDYVYTVLKRAKRSGFIHPYISISMNRDRS